MLPLGLRPQGNIMLPGAETFYSQPAHRLLIVYSPRNIEVIRIGSALQSNYSVITFERIQKQTQYESHNNS